MEVHIIWLKPTLHQGKKGDFTGMIPNVKRIPSCHLMAETTAWKLKLGDSYRDVLKTITLQTPSY